ncbi:hypothetical protein FHQ18_11340 [Deferribacter autotrophicus]|uniref:DUF4252 domain-containing protein n=1 Tax=Deferribacter autotrophicus TaxID=500465 RepID=A0A5A8F2P2_9BACT|nr:hypothetical protein [Deferribacter autotrophicus]KAA0257155.1 hypothetical protein FHQ18_11340 [Deferribacter autotrophicus]
MKTISVRRKVGIEDLMFIGAIAIFIAISLTKINYFLITGKIPNYFSNMKFKNLVYGDKAIEKISLLFGKYNIHNNAYIAEYESKNAKLTVISMEFKDFNQLISFEKTLTAKLHIRNIKLNINDSIKFIERKLSDETELFFYLFTKQNKIFLLISNTIIDNKNLKEAYKIFE